MTEFFTVALEYQSNFSFFPPTTALFPMNSLFEMKKHENPAEYGKADDIDSVSIITIQHLKHPISRNVLNEMKNERIPEPANSSGRAS